MIILHQPYVESSGDLSYLKCDISDSTLNRNQTLWFSFDKSLEHKITYEVADAFLLIVLQVAMATNQDIESEAPVSSQLLFNVINGVLPILNKIYPEEKIIKITAPVIKANFGGTAVGTGCSLGVDSFSTIIDMMSDKFPKELRLTHMALFNSGQHGDDKLVEAEKQFFKDIEAVKAPAAELKLETIGINSNINQFFKDYKYPLIQRFVVCTCAFPLTLQKLFRAYAFASSYPIDNFALDPTDVSHTEFAIVPLLSTESTTIMSSDATYSRVDKTRILSTNKTAQKYLNVCWSSQVYNMRGTEVYLKGKTKLNCGKCDKCLRTLITLETLGHLQEFADIFDLHAYYAYRTKYLVKIVANPENNVFYKEIYDYMMASGFKIPLKVKIMATGVKMGLYKLAQKAFGLTTMAHD